jgi:hypothetical protein
MSASATPSIRNVSSVFESSTEFTSEERMMTKAAVSLHLPEVFVTSSALRRQISQWASKGRVRKIAPRLYTTNMTDQPAEIIQRNLWRVLALLFPGGVISHRTALELRPTADGTITLTTLHDRTVRLPGTTIRLVAGPGALPGDQPFMDTLFRASDARTLLEVLRPTRQRTSIPAGLRRDEVEAWLERKLRTSGEDALNAIRDAARGLAPALAAEKEANVLNGLIAALLGTNRAPLTAPAAIARSQGAPYDAPRLDRFQVLLAALRNFPAPTQQISGPDDRAFANAAFIDAYFSNFIEGTEFEVDEARAIVFENKLPENRPQDAHDIMSTYRLHASRDVMGRGVATLAPTYAEFEALIKARHRELMSQRPDMKPGEFKDAANRAGDSHFVAPELVRGTLRQGFGLLGALTEPFARAAYITFLLAEIHPFNDGNGRLARVMMNAELVSAGEARIIIPTVFRDDYLGGLRALTRQDRPEILLQSLSRAHAFAAQLHYEDLDATIGELAACHAFDASGESRLILPSERHRG